MATVIFDEVDVWYGSFQALHSISFELGSGAIGILGPNGAGKSTAMKTILGFNRARKGTVNILGHKMPEEALAVRLKIGYMPEREVMSPNISAVSFLTYCGELLGMTRVDALERAHEVLNYVTLGEARYRNMQTYSTGMLQRVKLGQALIHDPKILLLDEPTNGLDPDSRIEMLELVRDLAYERGITVLLSSHLLPDVQHVCEHILIINDGKVVKQGSMKELTELQDKKYEVRVRDNKNEFIQKVLDAGYQCGELKNGDLFIGQPHGLEPQALFEIARSCDTQIRHFRQARRTLAEAFMHALGDD
ncbi:MAG: ABC transporter ATP-binding protein [Candidatus Hydrogenedentota bacterium]